MALVLASAHLSDEDFLAAFHSCTLQNSQFHHADHLRLAWLHLHRQPFERALESVRSGIQRFALHHGAPGLYHETITSAWVRLLATHHELTFDEFLLRNRDRLSKDLLHAYWSKPLLDSSRARQEWVDPDLGDLPR